MKSTILSAITIAIICMVFYLVYRKEESDTQNDSRIVFAFSKTFKAVMLSCTIAAAMITLLFLGLAVFGEKEYRMFFVIIALFFSLLTLLASLLYLLARNKKVIYEGDVLYVSNLFGKEQTVRISEIIDAVENSSDGMSLVLRDNRKIKIDMQMNYYPKIKEILEKNNIRYHDRHGNTAPKGW